MRNGFIASAACLLAGAGLTLGQPPADTAPGSAVGLDEAPAPVWTGAAAPSVTDAEDGPAAISRLWFSSEYLLWWFKDSALPPSLITTGPNTDNPGALGHGGIPLTGPELDSDTFSGVRATVGMWLSPDQSLGIEASGFILPQQTKTVRFSSDSHGNPVLTFRYLDPPVNGVAAEDAFQASTPIPLPGGPPQLGPYAGSVGFTSSSRLWGAEANLVTRPGGDDNLRFQLLGGFRYLDLDEDLDLFFRRQAIAGTGANVVFQGTTFPAPSAVSSLDSFHTRNQFYGGQVGARGEYYLGRLTVGLTGKVALGDVHEVVGIFGTSTLIPAAGPATTVAGGQFAAPSNIGRATRDEFAVVPEVEVKVSYQLSQRWRAFAGYDFLYWSRVVRPGNQVDLIVDTRQDPVDPAFTGEKASFPQKMFNRTDFWAQGLNLGLEFNF